MDTQRQVCKRRSKAADKTSAYRMACRERVKRLTGESIGSQVTGIIALCHQPGVHGLKGTTY